MGNYTLPLVSVIIPIYNAEHYIAQTIESVVNQTYKNIELIIVNDGSTDKSLEVVSKFESINLKIFNQQNTGASSARNYGLRESKGEFIQFLDADDLLSVNKIEEQVKLLISNPDKLALCPTVHFFDRQNYLKDEIIHEWYQHESNDPVDFLIKLYGGGLIGPTYGGMIQPNAWLTPKTIIETAGYWNEELSLDDDGEFFCRVVLASNGICYADRAVNFYRKFILNQNLSSRKNEVAIQSAYKALLLKKSHLLARTNDSKVRIALARCFAEFSFSTFNICRNISQDAFKIGNELYSGINYPLFYVKGIKRSLSKVLGWKFIKRVELLKIRFISN